MKNANSKQPIVGGSIRWYQIVMSERARLPSKDKTKRGANHSIEILI